MFRVAREVLAKYLSWLLVSPALQGPLSTIAPALFSSGKMETISSKLFLSPLLWTTFRAWPLGKKYATWKGYLAKERGGGFRP